MHGPAALLQVGDAEAGVEATGEGEDDVFSGSFLEFPKWVKKATRNQITC
jgi:hypothetical protein